MGRAVFRVVAGTFVPRPAPRIPLALAMQLDEVFTADVEYDLTDFGQQTLRGVQECAAAAYALGERNPVGHHVTNVVLTEAADGCVQDRSMGIGVSADGTCGSVTYEDTIVRSEQGWRISRPKVLARRAPLGGTRGSD
jgi:hypothetical protein